jgi:hypothetical protein
VYFITPVSLLSVRCSSAVSFSVQVLCSSPRKIAAARFTERSMRLSPTQRQITLERVCTISLWVGSGFFSNKPLACMIAPGAQ